MTTATASDWYVEARRRAVAAGRRRQAGTASTEWPEFAPPVALSDGPLGEIQAADREIARLTAVRARAVARFAADRPAAARPGAGRAGCDERRALGRPPRVPAAGQRVGRTGARGGALPQRTGRRHAADPVARPRAPAAGDAGRARSRGAPPRAPLDDAGQGRPDRGRRDPCGGRGRAAAVDRREGRRPAAVEPQGAPRGDPARCPGCRPASGEGSPAARHPPAAGRHRRHGHADGGRDHAGGAGAAPGTGGLRRGAHRGRRSANAWAEDARLPPRAGAAARRERPATRAGAADRGGLDGHADRW